MNPRLISLVCAAAIGLGGTLWLQHQRIQRLDDELIRQRMATATESTLRQQVSARLAQETALREEHARAEAALRDDLATAHSLATRRAVTLEKLTHENAELRRWAATPLPDAARGLRERPAFDSAAAYRQWLSGRERLPAAAIPAADEQRSLDTRG
nr:Rz-like lysis system protein LysB [Laribacter hongkongensis]